MNAATILVIIIVAALVVLAARSLRKGGASTCSGCPHAGNCSECPLEKERTAKKS